MSSKSHTAARADSPEPDNPDSRLSSGAGWIASATLAVGLVNYAFALAMTAALSVAEFSIFGAGQALLLIVGTMAGASIPWLLASELSAARNDAERRRAVVWFATVSNLALGAIFGLGVGAVALRFATWPISLVLIGATVLIFAASTFVGWLQGNERFRSIAGVRVLEVTVKAAVGLAAVAFGAGAGGALSGFAVGAGIVVALGMWTMRSDVSIAPRGLQTGRLLRRAFSMGGIQLLVALMASVGAVVVVLLPTTATAAASYQVAALLGRAPTFLAGALALVAFPLMSQGSGRRAAIAKRAVDSYLVIAVPFGIALATMPAEVLGRLFPTYDALDTVLPMVAASGIFIGLIALLATSHQAAGRFRGTTIRLVIVFAFQVGGLVVGWSIGGVAGLATGEALALLLGAVVVAQWSSAVIPVNIMPSAMSLAFWGLLAVVLVALGGQPGPWLVAAALSGIAALYQGFRNR